MFSPENNQPNKKINMWSDGCINKPDGGNLSECMSNHHSVYLKILKFYMSIVPQCSWKKNQTKKLYFAADSSFFSKDLMRTNPIPACTPVHFGQPKSESPKPPIISRTADRLQNLLVRNTDLGPDCHLLWPWANHLNFQCFMFLSCKRRK